MNTNALKKFAQEARKKLIAQVNARMEKVLSYTDLTNAPAEIQEEENKIKKLRQAIEASSKTQIVDKVAYTWFNRFIALRFMDVNDYQPLDIRIVTPKDGGFILPELLDAAKAGNISEDLQVNRQRIFDLIDGKIPNADTQNEPYKQLLKAACNHLHLTFPFLFEQINDYTELLLPDDLISEFSILKDVRDGMPVEDCQEVEVIGWLYQFYISERKDEVFASKGKVEKEDIPAATQLFTPRWIVEYMVQNTLGKLWLQNKPNSNLRQHMPYFIESPSLEIENQDYLKLASVEDIQLLDQACGSGHILVYAFDLLTKIYEEEGYNASEIPQLIIEKNLFGCEIDDRAAQLAGMTLMLKARGYHRRVFGKNITPNILCFQDLKLKTYGEEGYREIFKVKKADVPRLELLDYGYVLADQIFKKRKQEIKDKKTGDIKEIEVTDIYFSSGHQVIPDDWKKIKESDNEVIAFYNDEIRNSFRELHLPLTESLYQDLVLIKQATNYGSLILPKTPLHEIQTTLVELEKRKTSTNAFLSNHKNELLAALHQLSVLAKKYHCVVDNPPYMGSGNMNKTLGDFVKKNYPLSKADLMVCFMERANTQLLENGYLGMINLPSWMFLSSFEKYREELINTYQIETLLQLGRGIFGSDFGTVAFTFRKTLNEKVKGVYRRLFEKHVQVRSVGKIKNLFLNNKIGNFVSHQREFKKISGSPIAYWLSENALNCFEEYDLLEKIVQPSAGMQTGNNNRFLRYHYEVSFCKISRKSKFVGYNKAGGFRRWYGLNEFVVNWENNAEVLKNTGKAVFRNKEKYFKKSISWGLVTSGTFNVREYDEGFVFDNGAPSLIVEENSKYLLGFLNSKISGYFLKAINPTLNFQVGNISNLPIKLDRTIDIEKTVTETIEISKKDWLTQETSPKFQKNELLRHRATDLEESYDSYCQYWTNKFHQLHRNEEELNRQFIDIYDLQEELTPDVPLKDITILKAETSIEDGQLVFDAAEVVKQLVSYAVGCMVGRYSLDKEGLILANQGETLADFCTKVGKDEADLSFVPDDDNIIPILDDEWFEDDIVGRFLVFLKVTFGEADYEKNLAFVEEKLGKPIRKYFVKDFYPDHIKRYKKRPIYWMFSSPKGSFNVLVYLHRYTKDTLNTILNDYLVQYREKLRLEEERMDYLIASGTDAEQNRAAKAKDKIRVVMNELNEYEREILYPLATERIELDLDDGVLVNYNKFGQAIKEVKGLNDKKAKAKVRKFDWIDVEAIRD